MKYEWLELFVPPLIIFAVVYAVVVGTGLAIFTLMAAEGWFCK